MKTLYHLNTEITKLGMMKYIMAEDEQEWVNDLKAEYANEEWAQKYINEIENRMVERVRMKVWIDTVPEISVTAEGQYKGKSSGTNSILEDDGTTRFLDDELREKAKEAGIEGKINFHYNIFPTLDVIVGTRRERNGIGAGWCSMDIYIEDWNWNTAIVFHTPEDAEKRHYTPDKLTRIHCWFNDNHQCTVIKAEEKEEKQ